MEIKIIKYWKVELFELQPKSVIAQMLAEKRQPFFTGYSKVQINPEKLHGSEFISLAPSPDSLALQAFRLYRVDEIKCSPVYEQEVDPFAEASEPLIKWLSENVHPHHCVIVTATHAELLEGQRVHNTDKFLKDKIIGDEEHDTETVAKS
jgi:hypothetical protein